MSNNDNLKPSEYFYCVDEVNDPENPSFCLTSKAYWDKYGHLDDCLSEIDALPDGFYNLMEACWEYDGSIEEGKAALHRAGFVFSQEMHNYINNQNS